MKEYPKVDTLKAIEKIIKEFGISPSPVLMEGIKEEIKKYKKFTIEDINPCPKEILESTIKNDKGDLVNGIVILFENPYRYVEIVDEEGNICSVDDLPEAKIVDMMGLWINRNDNFDVQFIIINPTSF